MANYPREPWLAAYGVPLLLIAVVIVFLFMALVTGWRDAPVPPEIQNECANSHVDYVDPQDR